VLQDALLAGIAERPEDSTAKLVYADWLDESGDSVAAKLTRDLCRVYAGRRVKPYPVPVETLRSVARGFATPRERIDELTSFEKRLLPWFRESWLAAGLAVGPCDRPACEAAADLAYKAAGLPPPTIRVWLAGPLHGAIGAAMLASPAIRDQVRGQVWDQVWDQVWGQVSGQVWGQVRDQVWDQVSGQVSGQVRDQVRDQVWDQVRDQVRGQVSGQVWGQVWRAGYGQHDAGWLSFYATFSSAALAACDRLAGLFALSACGWWWPFAGACVFTERPTRLEMDGGRLELVEYADGLRAGPKK